MKNYNHSFTEEQIKNMSHNEWLKAGKPCVRYARETEVLAIIASLEVGKIYEADHGTLLGHKNVGVYRYEGGEQCALRSISASSGFTPLVSDGETINQSTALALKESSITPEEFEAQYNATSDAMFEWCQKYGSE